MKKKKRVRWKNGIAKALRSPNSPFKKRVVKDKRKKFKEKTDVAEGLADIRRDT